MSYSQINIVSSHKLGYIVGFGLVEMAISTNPKPTIYCHLYENTRPGAVCYFPSHFSTSFHSVISIMMYYIKCGTFKCQIHVKYHKLVMTDTIRTTECIISHLSAYFHTITAEDESHMRLS